MTSTVTKETTLTLLEPKIKMPQLGFGVYKSPPEVTEASTTVALKAGYRNIDSAQFYRNEEQVGNAVKKSGIPREQVFLSTKVLSSAGSVEATLQKCRESVAKMDPRPDGYVDLFLIHSPNAGLAVRKELWLALEQLQTEGKAKAIGVSNYGRGHIEEMKKYAKVWPPVVNQIELHPWAQQREAVAYCQSQGIHIQAYSPLIRMQRQYEPVLTELGEKHGKQTTQILIRYALQKGWNPLPKSDTPKRIEANFDVFDFSLTEEEMKRLDDQDLGSEGNIVQAVTNDL